MGQKKNSKLILIIMILLVVLILITGAMYAYFATDIFKSDKELFFKYITQMGDQNGGFLDKQLKEYLEQQKNVSYRNEGTFFLNVTSEKGSAKEYEAINNFNISFSGQTNHATNSSEQNISLNYSDDVKFPVSYRKIGNTVGLQTKYVGSKYIVVETDKLEDETLAELETINELAAGTEKIEKASKELCNPEEWENIKETYIKVLNSQLQDSQFTKIEENNMNGYRLKIEGEQVKNILIQLLETLKNDQMTLEKINGLIEEQKNTTKITANTIDNYIKDIERNSDFSDESYEITIFQEKGKITKLVIATQEEEIKLEKRKEENLLQYTISFATISEEDDVEISLNANYSGLASMQSVKETYEVQIQNYKYQYNNQVDFTNEVRIEEFSDENAMILNNYEEEQVSNFLGQVVERIQIVNQQQMEELGLEENENPLIQMIMLPMQTLINSEGIGTINSSTSNMSEIEVNAFNERFENYESTNLQGTTVKGLLSTIQLNNESQEDKERQIKEIHFDGEEYEVNDQNIVFLKSSVEIESNYRVEFERYEDTGLIYRAVINKK